MITVRDDILGSITRYYTDFSMFFKYILNPFQSARRSYFDVASSTPINLIMHRTFPRVPTSILGANPSALHREGVKAREMIEDARKIVATVLHAHHDEIIFTSGATESDNLALRGVIDHALARGIVPQSTAVMTSALEHAAVLETVGRYKHQGVLTISLPTDQGSIDPKNIIVPEGCKFLVVSVMYVNNEIGTVLPIEAVAKRIRYLRKHHPGVEILFHCDATQAPVHYSMNVSTLGVDLMTLGATKLYTHKGIGVLYKKRNVSLLPIMYGGGQEGGLRPGTESLELVWSFAHALKYAQTIRDTETKRVEALQTYFEQLVQESLPQVLITAKNQERSPHITHLAIKDMDSELLVIELDARGIAVSAKSACKNEDGTESEIVEMMYGPGYGAVRFSFGRMTTKKDIRKAVKAVRDVIKKYNKE
jgi:cysteine desulfurase